MQIFVVVLLLQHGRHEHTPYTHLHLPLTRRWKTSVALSCFLQTVHLYFPASFLMMFISLISVLTVELEYFWMLIGWSSLNQCMTSSWPPCCTWHVKVTFCPGLKLVSMGSGRILAEMLLAREKPTVEETQPHLFITMTGWPWAHLHYNKRLVLIR